MHFFDTVVLLADRIRLGDGTERTFDQLGVPEGGTLALHAREILVDGAPPERSLTLVADTLAVRAPTALHYTHSGRFPAPFPRIDITAQTIVGPLSVICRGKPGAAGTPGKNGTVVRKRVFDPEIKKWIDDGESHGTNGTAGGPGGPGGPGGHAVVRFVASSQTISAAAPGGAGGAGGAGGKGGVPEDPSLPRGQNGAGGPSGAPGPAGAALAERRSSPAELWQRWSASASVQSTRWAAHRTKVAEFHFRQGTPAAFKAARAHLDALLGQPNIDGQRVVALIHRLSENVTFTGHPRDLDVTPDVAFVAQDNDALFQTALLILGNAQTVAGVSEIQGSFAQVLRSTAQQAANTLKGAELRVEQATKAKSNAASGVDLARGRYQALSADINELRKELTQTPDALEALFQIGQLAVGVASMAFGVGAGVAAVVDVAEGFGKLQKSYEGAKTLAEMGSIISQKLDSKEFKDFKQGLKDVGNAGKSIYDFGKLTQELDVIKASHPVEGVRQLASMERQRTLLARDIALQTQVELEAGLGLDATRAERDAITANIAVVQGLATELETRGRLGAEPVLRALLGSIRQLLDFLSSRAFLTLRAREIYLALDPLEVVRHDLGHLHPDREAVLAPADVVREITAPVAARALQIIQWSSLVDQMEVAGGLSRTPIPFFFATDDPAMIEGLRQTGTMPFQVALEDLLEENGSQVFEVKLDSVEIALHGATIPGGAGQSVRLTQHGRWSVRRRDGVVKSFAMPPQEAHLACKAVGGRVEGALAAPANPRAQPPFSLWGRGVAGDWALSDEGGVDMSGVTRVEIGFHAQALSKGPILPGGRATPRRLRPLPGWPPAPVPPHLAPRPAPLSGPAYGAYGGVAAIGLELV